MLAASVLLVALEGEAGSGKGREQPAPGAQEIFSELEGSGVDFMHFNGATGEYFLPEITCGGAALMDYDGDGDLDLYLVQGALIDATELEDTVSPSSGGEPPTDRLYRNDLEIRHDGSRSLHFVDVTETSNLEAVGYGCGVAAGDFDNDGWTDIYLPNLGSNQLLRNRGDGTFEDVTRASGTDDERWSVPAVWIDLDRDGWLDLYVGNYLEFDVSRQKTCRTSAGVRDYCNPAAYLGVPDSLFHNRGDGTFEDVTSQSGLGRIASKSLGAVAADFNGDRLPDLYVTNDGVENQLWIQRGGLRFEDEAILAGCAVNRLGKAEASMGVAASDFDSDGDLDLFMTHLSGESNTLYVNDGRGMFEDLTVTSGLGPPSWRFTSWGLAWFDYDNDGLLDLAIVNGAVRAIDELIDRGDPFPFHQPNQLFRHAGGRRYEEVSGSAGRAFALSEVSRALAVGDLDNDGDHDLVVVNINGPARVLINSVGHQSPWLGVRPVGGSSRRDLIGSRIELVHGDGERTWGRSRVDGSFASSNDPRVLFGLAQNGPVKFVRVHWPSGPTDSWSVRVQDRYVNLAAKKASVEP